MALGMRITDDAGNDTALGGGKGVAKYPPDHQPGMQVPQGGSDCAKCEYVRPGNTCSNQYFIAWNRSNKIPEPIDQYCSDWFEAADHDADDEGEEDVQSGPS